MKIGIMVFSRTEHTLLVAEKLRDALTANGHDAVIERIHAANEDPNDKGPIRLTEAPDPSAYNRVIFGGSVQAFGLTPIMKAYMWQLPAMHGMQVACYVTQHFAESWMGGNQAIRKMVGLCRAKGAEVRVREIVNWMNKSRDKQIDDVVQTLAQEMEIEK